MGKSTLFNRLTKSRRSIVGDEPGITRDRIYGEVEWLGRTARLVDTGGIVPDDEALIPAAIFQQAQVALEEADAVVMVVDGRTELASPDLELARLLIRSGKPVFLAVNKTDTDQMEAQAQNFRRLGIREVFPISAEHGNGIEDLLDAVYAVLDFPPEAEEPEIAAESEPVEETTSLHRTHGEYRQRETSIAIIGRPNVGKSTLLNALTGTSRAIVSPVAGTTRDAVDEVMDYQGTQLRFIDTAGIRRKGKTHMMAEKLSVIMAIRHLEAADVALLVIDATEGVTSTDATIGGYAHESGRSVIIVVNKWDLVTSGRTDGKPPADRAIFELQLRTRAEVSELCAGGLSLCVAADQHAPAAAADCAGDGGAPQARLHGADEPVSGADRLPARHRADVEESAGVLHDAGGGRPTDVRLVHGQAGEAALLFRTLPREPDPGVVRFHRIADLVQGAGAEPEGRGGVGEISTGITSCTPLPPPHNGMEAP